MNDDSFSVEYEKESILIDGSPYLFSVFLSAEDCFALIDTLDKNPNQCRRAISEYIWKRIDVPEEKKPSIDRMMVQADDFFTGIFEKICRDDDALKSIYEARTDDTDICHRFVSALKAEFEDVPLKQLTKASVPLIQIPQISTDVLEAGRIALERWNKIPESVTTAYTNICNMVSQFAQYSDTWFESIQKAIETAYQIGNKISDILQTIYIPELSEEQKERLRVSHGVWGKYGWTQPLSAPEAFLNTPPIDRKDANAKALAYCKNADMEELFVALLNLPHSKKSDVNEAIFAFRNRRYKSCALILFTLIDARMIRLQRKEDRREKDKYREVGKGAAKKLFKRIEKEKDIHKKTFVLFFHENIFSCLLTVFAGANDFKVQPDGINRNFLGHGMLTRKVVRKDCVQLFLLYYNLLDYLGIIYGR